jgi:hypothetical protein
VRSVGLYCIITLQCTVQKTKLPTVVFSYGDLFYDFVSISYHCSFGRVAGEWEVGKDVELSGKGMPKVFSYIYGEGLRKTKVCHFLI